MVLYSTFLTSCLSFKLFCKSRTSFFGIFVQLNAHFQKIFFPPIIFKEKVMIMENILIKGDSVQYFLEELIYIFLIENKI